MAEEDTPLFEEIRVLNPGPPSVEFVVKDSGVREERGNGFVRDTEDGKPDLTEYLKIEGLDLIPPHWIARVAAHMLKGAEKYGRSNWQNAQEQADVARFDRSLCRHVRDYLRRDMAEDHPAALFFNVMAAQDTERKVSPENE